VSVRAILVAVQEYAGGAKWNRLRSPVNDTAYFAKWLISKGVPAAGIRVLHSPVSAAGRFTELGITDIHSASEDAIKRTFNTELPGWPESELIVFWAGHGWFGDGSVLLSAQEASDADLRLLDFDSLLARLRSKKAAGFQRQSIFVSACAKRMPAKMGAAAFDPGELEKKTEQNSYFAASPGQTAEDKDEMGWFGPSFWEKASWPLDKRELRDLLEDAYDQRDGIIEAQPMVIEWSLGKAHKRSRRGALVRDDALLTCAKRAGLTPLLLERLAAKSAACPSFDLPERRALLAQRLSKTTGKPFVLPGAVLAEPESSFQMLWAYAREHSIEQALLNAMNETEQGSNEYSVVEGYLDAATEMFEHCKLLRTLQIPSSTWRAWFDAHGYPSDSHDLELLMEPLFESSDRARAHQRFLDIVTRAWLFSGSDEVRCWLEPQLGWKPDRLKSDPAGQRQIVYAEAGANERDGLVLKSVRLWRPVSRTYQAFPLEELDPDAPFQEQLVWLNQELTLSGKVPPDVGEIVFEVALPAEALNRARLPAELPVMVRWFDRLHSKDRRLGAAEWARFGTAIHKRCLEEKRPPRAKWLEVDKCCAGEALYHLRSEGAEARELIGLTRVIDESTGHRNELIEILKSGAPFACWHHADPGDWAGFEDGVQNTLNTKGLEGLPGDVRNRRYGEERLRSLVLFFDDPRRDPYPKFGGLR